VGLKPQNIVQAAEADLVRKRRNMGEAEMDAPCYEHYAFHRKHVRRAVDAKTLIMLALMDPVVKTIKPNTLLIYGNARLLVEAIRLP
jgi:hypothetical protein